MVFRVFCDGGARGNPGPAAIGVVIKDEQEKVLHKIRKAIGVATNNVAEYTAVLEGLSWISTMVTGKPEAIKFYLDSQLVVSQLNGLYKMKNARLRELFIQIRQMEALAGGNISYYHIPREKNVEADRLVNEALDNT
mgnify:CR=1 FL=1